MPLESLVTDIDDLNPAWPAPADAKSDGDDHLRELKKALLNDFAGYTGAILCTGTDGGAANAYTITPATSQPLPAYGLRMGVVFSPTVANTGACTLNISALGAKSLRAVDGSALVAGDLVVGVVYAAYYNGTEFRLTGPTQKYIDLVRDYASQLSFAGVLPAQAGNAGKFITTDGANASWAIPLNVFRSARTANVALTVSDKGTLVDITSGTFTQTFSAAATLASGWYCWLRNTGAGDITLDPNGAELIDGLTSYVMYPGETRLVQCDGSTFISFVLNGFLREFLASGTWAKPPGYIDFEVDVVSAGSSGSTQGGGGGGGRYRTTVYASSLAASVSVVVGSGGIWASGTTVAPGGDSSFGPISVKGAPGTVVTSGNGGSAFFLSSSNPGIPGVYLEGGTGSNGNQTPGYAIWGGGAGGFSNTATNAAQNAAGSQFAGGGGGGVNTIYYGSGGASGTIQLGTGGAGVSSGNGSTGASAANKEVCGAGGGASASGRGGNGGFPGGGGGAGSTGGGTGGNGVVRIRGLS